MANNQKAKPEMLIEQQIEPIIEAVKTYRSHLPKPRPPIIAVTGKLGSGKTTTINTLFGDRVGRVLHDKPATKKPMVHIWESEDENIHIVDCPGLGESDTADKVIRTFYKQWAKKADGFIVVVTPPRPAELGTLKSVKTLLQAGVSSSNIIFGLNKVSQLMYDDDDGKPQYIKVNGLLGVGDSDHLYFVDKAKKALLADLRKNFPGHKFTLSQIIEYDALSGWNLYKMLTAVVNLLPYEALPRFLKGAKGGDKVSRREETHLRREKRRIQNLERKLRLEEEDLEKEKNLERGKTKQRKAKKKLEKAKLLMAQRELAEQRRQVAEREQGLRKFQEESNKYKNSFIRKATSKIADIVKPFSPKKAKAIRKAGESMAGIAGGAKDVVKKGWDFIRKKFKW